MEDEFEAANKRGAASKAAFPVVGARYDPQIDRVVVILASGLELAFPPKLAQGLEHAQPDELATVELTPSGLGLHFPKLDADIYLPALLEGVFGSRRWTAAQMGKLGGSSTSGLKSAAARENGKLGGRPKKSVLVTNK